MLNNKLMLERGQYKKYLFKDYEIFVMKEKYREPRFHITKNINRRLKTFNDFQFSISLTKTFENNEFRILDSSTGYNNLNNFEQLKTDLNK